MTNACSFCGNKNFTSKRVQYKYRHNSQFLVVNNVPCEECEYCGEQYFEAETLKKIEKNYTEIYSRGKTAKKQIKVPIEEFTEI
ncbi:MAG: YgiT-type zinc finger protein [candidate division Zixibacteria bacterium]|nr:YgiT-type zinc finger protein [candidate division Zixibacteria bacterium]